MTVKQQIGAVVRKGFTSRRAFMWARYEMQMAAQRALNAMDPRYYLRLRELARRDGLSLNLGAGGVGLEGWVNIDGFPSPNNLLTLDLRRPLPFRTGQVRRIFASHVLEHLDFDDDVPRLLSELHRVLEPGGVLRVIVPDARRFLEAYASRAPEAWRELGWDLAKFPDDIHTPMHAVNHIFHQQGEHMFGYDFETLEFVMRRAGFANVVRQTHGQCLDPELALDLDQHKPYSLYVDAQKGQS